MKLLPKGEFLGLLTVSEQLKRQSKIEGLEQELRDARRRIDKLELRLTINEDTALPNKTVLNAELEAILKATPYRKAVLFLTLNERYNTLKATLKRTSPSMPAHILNTAAESIVKAIDEHAEDVVKALRTQGADGAKVIASFGDELGRVYHTREDEFLILLKYVNDKTDFKKLCRSIFDKVSKGYILDSQNVSLGINIGYALYPDHGESKSILQRHADIALSEAIKNKNLFEPFTPELRDRMIEQEELQKKIIKAIEANESGTPQLVLYFQPQVQVSDWNTPQPRGKVLGAEVLIRWQHPTDGLISPGKFIPAAESSGSILKLGEWILHTSITYIQDLVRLGFDELTLSVNVSSIQMNTNDFLDQMQRKVARLKDHNHLMKLELTESGMVNADDTIDKILQLKNMGFTILLDDFGTGYSSLSYLKDLPVDVVKIDKSFVDGVPSGEKDVALTRTIITLAKELQKGIIVEGTETREQIDWLYEQGCEVFQGYFFGKPMPYVEFVDYLKKFPTTFAQKAIR